MNFSARSLTSGAHGVLCPPQTLGTLRVRPVGPKRGPNGPQGKSEKAQCIHGLPLDPMRTPLGMPCPLRWDPGRPQWDLMNTLPSPLLGSVASISHAHFKKPLRITIHCLVFVLPLLNTPCNKLFENKREGAKRSERQSRKIRMIVLV